MDVPFVIDGLTLCRDVVPAAWAVAAVRDFDGTVGSLVPPVFAAYARVFHPARRRFGGPAGPVERTEEVTWAQVARANGRLAHPAMQWPCITGSWRFVHADDQPGLWEYPPEEGSLPVRHAARLAALLAGHTRAPQRCWFAVWEGYGDLALPVEDAGVPRVAMPGRDMLLLSGPLSAAATSFAQASWGHQSASLWWPEDRAWCVATDVDLMSTYIGGSGECIAQVVADAQLEVLAVDVDDALGWDGDRINPAPADRDRL
ncbi:hypothetical protein HS048_34260 [Planomonospora sp. ID91781]|uniref:hypothetical protein n=1 Tax=Planomonospora sp. ID91781 TaxID=2738135 RepID=UPI0018C3C7BF|nr:hypothetical protein [Planomonospora sp. ID91781]MBG0825750.1 hypothetical protein [Planomonospora sp. ID91781]